MRFKEELELYISAPREEVWEALQDFGSWPTWSSYLKVVTKDEKGWHFRARAMPPVDLVWVAEAIKRDPPEFLEFRSVPGVEHNLDVSGWVRLTEQDGKTHLEMHFEARPDYASPLMERIAEAYASWFGEPNKVIKVTMEQLKAHLEEDHKMASQHVIDPI